MFVVTCALLVMAATQVWSQYTYCFPYGKGEFQDVAFVNRDTGMAIGRIGVSVVLRTTNSGVTWDTTALPPSTGKKKYDAQINEYSKVVLHRNGTGIVFSRYANYSTGDFGRTWTVLPYDEKTYIGFQFANQDEPYFTPQIFDDSLVYANLGNDGILRSTDLGQTWSEIPVPRDSNTTGIRLMTFASPSHGWISTGFGAPGRGGFVETIDGCITFSQRRSNPVGLFRCLNDSMLVGYSSYELYVSKDSGATWTKHWINKLDEQCSAAVFVDTNRICFSQEYELYSSKDGGKNLHITKFDPFDQANAMCIADSQTYFAAMRFGIIRITNGGFPDTTTSVSADDGSPPFECSITPNPSHHEADVHITIREPQNVRLTIVTTDGRLVIDRELGVVQPGTITEHLALPSGAYICTCTVGIHRQTTPISITR